MKVCKSFIDQPQFTYNGDQYTWQRFQQSSPRHPDVEIWARYPDGNVVADIECHVDAQNRKVNWARLLPNPPLTDKSWDYAKSKRWCQEDSPDYSDGANTGAAESPNSRAHISLRARLMLQKCHPLSIRQLDALYELRNRRQGGQEVLRRMRQPLVESMLEVRFR